VATPIPIARFFARAILRRRRMVPYSHSLYLVRVVLGSLVLDASRFPVDLGGTMGVIEAIVLGGRLEIVVPPGVEVRAVIRRGLGGRMSTAGESDHGSAHLLLRGTVALGRIDVRSVEPT
jgi:hypothetical protein